MAAAANRFTALDESDDEEVAPRVAPSTAGHNNTGDGKRVRHNAPRGSAKGRERSFDRHSASRPVFGKDETTKAVTRAAAAAPSAKAAVAEAEKAEGVADATAATAGARTEEAAEEVPDNSVTYEDYMKARKREGEAFEELAPAAVDTSSGDYKGKAFVSKTELADFSNPVGDAGLEGGRKQRRQRRRGDGRTDIGDFATSALGFVTDSAELPRGRGEGRPAGRGRDASAGLAGCSARMT